jgi:hypothetical protein
MLNGLVQHLPVGIHLATQSSLPEELLQAQQAGQVHDNNLTAPLHAAAAANFHPPFVGAMVLRALVVQPLANLLNTPW